MSITYVTLAIPGKHSKKSLSQMLAPIFMLARQAFGIVATHNRSANSVKELPHAFSTFDTATTCANDNAWHARAVGTEARKRPNLCEIRALQLLPNTKNNEVESDH